ncbi:MAG: D-alanyl-D-alanine carboxypeptidase/D-alanyl-D-alanine-endopeptidase, partial [Actinomycetota bacterium]|nr:D-alanyl-D-alanine carboxypeptidase/D-alanyl-D-alanine-endopeptidase [Actinomycetota bacterium]
STPAGVPGAPALLAAPVLAPDLPGEVPPETAALRAALDPVLAEAALRDGVGAVVLEPATGALLYDAGASTPRVPASVVKLVTAAAALQAVGPQTRLRTRVLAGAAPGELVLVGGGDPVLSARDLDALAAQTAAALRTGGGAPSDVTVLVDDSLFSGPGVNPHWRSSYVRGAAVVAPVSALAVHRTPGSQAPRDPALAAGRQLAERLRAKRVELAGPVRRGRADAGAPELAATSSPPVAVLVEEALAASDNDVVEVLARLVAVAEGRPATAEGAAAAVGDVVTRLGVAPGDLRLLDGSGLARDTAVPPAVLARLLARALSAEHPELRPLVTGLPVGGFTGTLAGRFPPSTPGAGSVRAKTGTLTGVSSLAGTVRDADGRVLVFAVLADSVPSGATDRARAALDRFAGTLASCGCP